MMNYNLEIELELLQLESSMLLEDKRGGNPEIEFKGASSMDMVTDVGASLGESINFIDSVNSERGLEDINVTLDKYDNAVKSYDLNKVSKTTVDKLGDVIR